MAEKKCTKCGEIKPLNAFNKKASHSTGLNPWCRQCASEGLKAWIQNNADRKKQMDREYAERTREQKRQYDRDRYHLVANKAVARSRAWYAANKERVAARDRANRPARLARDAKRRANKVQATPFWFEAELIERLYAEAQQRNFEVDHVVPLVSKKVCGLHCWHNLQLMAFKDNAEKGNRHWPHMW